MQWLALRLSEPEAKSREAAYQEVIGHFRGQPLQFHHAFRLQVLDRVVEEPVVALGRWPGHEDVLEYLEHEARILV